MSRPKTARPDSEHPSHLDLALENFIPGHDASQRVYEDKRIDYARAGIPEYGIVDPQENQGTVWVLQNNSHIEHAVFGIDDIVSGWLLPALRVDVREMLCA